MITSKLVVLEKQISKALPGFYVEKTYMIMPPVERLVRGINFDRSAYDEASFSVTAFMMLLCVPTTHFGFTFAERIEDVLTVVIPQLGERLRLIRTSPISQAA